MSLKSYVDPLFSGKLDLLLIGTKVKVGEIPDYDFLFINKDELNKIKDNSLALHFFDQKESGDKFASLTKQAKEQAEPDYQKRRSGKYIVGLASEYIISRIIPYYKLDIKKKIMIRLLIEGYRNYQKQKYN